MSRTSPASHLTHDELPSTAEMVADCRALGQHRHLDGIAQAVESPAPSIHFADYPREIPKRDIQISEAATRLANALHLHLD